MEEKEREKNKDRFGKFSIVAGIIGLILDFFSIYAFAFSVGAIVLAYKQKKIGKNRYSKIGRIIGLVGLGIYLFILLMVAYMLWVADFGMMRIIN